MKISSIMVYTLTPLYITQVLGASTFVVGLLEGFLEGITLFSRIFSGILSDIVHSRKNFIIVGYILTLIARPLMAMTTTVEGIFFARTLDRIGNGLDATPRDALVGDLAPPSIKGACYGLRESLSRAGAFSGSLITMGLLWITANDYPLVFWLGAIPTAVALIVLLIFVRDPEREKIQTKLPKKNLRFQDILSLPLGLWIVLIVSGFYNISNFSGAFLILRTEQTGLDIHMIPLVMVIQNIATTLTAYPAGYLSDKVGKRIMLLLGIVLVIISDILLAQGTSLFFVLGGVLLWGAEIGITQSMLAVLLADVCPPSMRGTGFGLFHLINGLSLIIANTLAGWLWSSSGPTSTFYASAAIAGLTIFMLPFIGKTSSKR